jgi:hypothetical protein
MKLNTKYKVSNRSFNSLDLVKLACNNTPKNHEEFGPSFLTSNVNYTNVLASCQNNCMKIE